MTAATSPAGTPACIWPIGARLGEGPVWHAGEQRLYFVDIKGRKLHRCAADGSARDSFDMPDETGFALPVAGGGMICGLPGQLVHYDTARSTFTPVVTLEEHLPGNRMNDAHVGPDGALWFGSMDNAEEAPTGALYRYDGSLRRQDEGYVITNGPAFSPDRATFYHTDTLGKIVHAFDVDAQGRLSNKRVFATIAGSGWPDGTAVDADGCVWVALFGGGRVERYAPSGELLDAVAFPCPNVTKIAFGGPDLRTAFATTAWKGMTDEARARHPHAGGLFAFPVAVPGLPAHAFTLDKSR